MLPACLRGSLSHLACLEGTRQEDGVTMCLAFLFQTWLALRPRHPSGSGPSHHRYLPAPAPPHLWLVWATGPRKDGMREHHRLSP